MSNTSYIVFSAFVILSVLYGLEDRWPIGRLGFSAASMIAAKGRSAPVCWTLELAALEFALAALRRRYVRPGRDDHVKFFKSCQPDEAVPLLNGLAARTYTEVANVAAVAIVTS
jgi:hypothetical protein